VEYKGRHTRKRFVCSSTLPSQIFIAIEYTNSMPSHHTYTYKSRFFSLISAYNCRPAANAAEAMSTIWLPMEIRPVTRMRGFFERVVQGMDLVVLPWSILDHFRCNVPRNGIWCCKDEEVGHTSYCRPNRRLPSTGTKQGIFQHKYVSKSW